MRMAVELRCRGWVAGWHCWQHCGGADATVLGSGAQRAVRAAHSSCRQPPWARYTQRPAMPLHAPIHHLFSYPAFPALHLGRAALALTHPSCTLPTPALFNPPCPTHRNRPPMQPLQQHGIDSGLAAAQCAMRAGRKLRTVLWGHRHHSKQDSYCDSISAKRTNT